jgi:hypothetical protein
LKGWEGVNPLPVNRLFVNPYSRLLQGIEERRQL